MNSLFGALSTGFLSRRICLDKKLCLGVRSLFNAQYLGIDSFIEAREGKRKSFGGMKDNFMARMKQQVNSSSSALIFTEDLKSVLFLACESEDDLDICTQMIKKFHAQNQELRFGTFVFGPIVMRLLYHLQKVDLALQLIKDEETQGFFDQLKSYLTVMDLLYENGRYQDVLDLNDQLISKQLMDNKYPRDAVLLTLAACYKLNTPESYKYAIEIITKAREAGSVVIRRALHFAIALALNQNQPAIAMELLSNLRVNNYVTSCNLRILTLVKLDRLQDALSVLQGRMEQDVPIQTAPRGFICQSVFDVLKEALEKADDTELSHMFEQLVQSLNENDCILSETIDHLLSIPIAPRQVYDDRNQYDRFGGERRSNFGERNEPFYRNRRNVNERDEPFFRRRSNTSYRQQTFEGISSE